MAALAGIGDLGTLLRGADRELDRPLLRRPHPALNIRTASSLNSGAYGGLVFGTSAPLPSTRLASITVSTEAGRFQIHWWRGPAAAALGRPPSAGAAAVVNAQHYKRRSPVSERSSESLAPSSPSCRSSNRNGSRHVSRERASNRNRGRAPVRASATSVFEL
jgi:hypothetical protein